MKICFILGGTDYNSSLYLATRDVADEITKKGHTVSYVFFEEQKNLLDGDEYYYINGITNKSLKRFPGLIFRLLKKFLGNHLYHYALNKYFSSQISDKLKKYDVVFIHGQSCIALNSLKLSSFIVVHSAKYENLILKHRIYKRWIYSLLYKKAYSGARLLTVSEGVKHDMLNKVKAKPEFIDMVYNGFNFERIKNSAKSQVVKGLPDRFIMAAGRPDRTKRFDVLIKAYALTQRKHKLVIFGEGRGLKKLKKLTKKLGVEKDVIFWGFCKDILGCFNQADAYILSSDIEGLPTVVVESLILKTPVIATDACGVRELLKGELSNWIVPRGDYLQLAKKIDEILSSAPIVSEDNIYFLNSKNIAEKYLEYCEDFYDEI